MEILRKEWRQDAQCASEDPELFDESSDKKKMLLAKEVCKKCIVSSECLDYAINNHENVGIWGGLTPYERNHLQ